MHRFPEGYCVQAVLLPQQPALSVKAAHQAHTACSCSVKVSRLVSPQPSRTPRRQRSCLTATQRVPTTRLTAWSCRALRTAEASAKAAHSWCRLQLRAECPTLVPLCQAHYLTSCRAPTAW